MLSVYNYLEPHAFLKDAWAAKRAKNPQFSLRSWAKKLGFENNAPLSLMLTGKRPIPKKYIPQFIRDLDLTIEEGQYLEALIDRQKAKTAESKALVNIRLKKLIPATVEITEIDHVKYLENPLYFAILEMTDLREFSADPKWLKSRLRIPATLQEISLAIERMDLMGVLRKGPEGHYIKRYPNVSNKWDKSHTVVQNYHQNVSKIAQDQVCQQNIDQREFSAFIMNITEDKIPRAKELMRNFVREFITEIEAPPQVGKETFMLNMQFFGLTKPADEADHA